MTAARYRHLAIDDPQAPATDEEIAAIEQALGAKLPDDFKEFLAVANGGYLEYEVEVEHPEGKEPMGFSGLFATRRDAADASQRETFLGELAAAREAFQLPREVLPMARDGGGSMLFLDLTEQGAGRVVAFVQGLPAWTGSAQSSAFVEVAPSFSAYVEKLFIPEDLARELIEDAMSEGDEERLTAVRQWLDIGMPDWRERLGFSAEDVL